MSSTSTFSVENFDFNHLPSNFKLSEVPEWFPSICIPRSFSNIDRRTIHTVFADLFGKEAIDRVDVVARENDYGDKFNRVFVHFTRWPRTSQSAAVRMRLLEGETINIVYDEPWFWKCSASRVGRPRPISQAAARPYVILLHDKDEQPRQAAKPTGPAVSDAAKQAVATKRATATDAAKRVTAKAEAKAEEKSEPKTKAPVRAEAAAAEAEAEEEKPKAVEAEAEKPKPKAKFQMVPQSVTTTRRPPQKK